MRICILLFTLLCSSAFLAGCLTPEETINVSIPIFDIIPTSVTNSLYSKGNFTVPIYIDVSAKSLTLENSSDWVNPVIRFVVNPTHHPGATVFDHETLYFSINNSDTTIRNEYRFIKKTGTNYLISWIENGDTLCYVKGSREINYNEKATFDVEFNLNEVGVSTMQMGETKVLYANFSNLDYTWTASYPIKFLVALRS